MKKLVVGVFLLVCALQAQSQQLTIEVDDFVGQPTPIAVVPFRWEGNERAPANFSGIVTENLRRSGLFDPMAESSMLSFPFPGQQVSFRDWRITDTEYLLIGTVRTVATGLEADIELYNVVTQELLLNSKVSGGPNDGRDVSHRVSDLVYETITGIQGIFGTKILYVTDDFGRSEQTTFKLMLADQDGAREQLVMESTDPIMSPAWSPDGTKIAYVSFETERSAIFIQDLASGQRRQLTNFKGINGAPAWSPDGKSMAMVLSKDGNPDIYVMNIASGSLKRVTNHFGIDTEPNWTPDGKSVVFTSDRGGRPQIYQAEVSSGDYIRLTHEGEYNARPRLSKDGRFLVMVHQRNGQFHIAVQDMRDDRVIIVTETTLDESPTVAPNGALVMYATKWQGRGILAAVSLDAGVKYRLPAQSGDVREPAWSPN